MHGLEEETADFIVGTAFLCAVIAIVGLFGWSAAFSFIASTAFYSMCGAYHRRKKRGKGSD